MSNTQPNQPNKKENPNMYDTKHLPDMIVGPVKDAWVEDAAPELVAWMERTPGRWVEDPYVENVFAFLPTAWQANHAAIIVYGNKEWFDWEVDDLMEQEAFGYTEPRWPEGRKPRHLNVPNQEADECAALDKEQAARYEEAVACGACHEDAMEAALWYGDGKMVCDQCPQQARRTVEQTKLTNPADPTMAYRLSCGHWII